MTFTRKSLSVLLLAFLLLTSCGGGQATTEPTIDANAIAETIAASFFQTQTALVPPATQTFTSTVPPLVTDTAIVLPTILVASPTTQVIYYAPSATPTLNLTLTRTPTGTLPTATVDPTKLAYGCNNLLLIADVTIPAGTVMKPNQQFTKTWKVANTGTCDWVYLYHPVLFSGDGMSAKVPNLGKVIPPGKWTQIDVVLTAPKNPGTYTGYWRFADQNGNMFGSTLTVSIIVSAPTNTPKPTSTSTTAPPTTAAPTGTFTQEPTATPETPTATP